MQNPQTDTIIQALKMDEKLCLNNFMLLHLNYSVPRQNEREKAHGSISPLNYKC